MFRTARGFLLVAPAAFALALGTFLLTHPQAAEQYATYPFLQDAFGASLNRRPVPRFAVTAGLFFLVPYLVGGVLLFFADVGVAAASPLWRGRGKPRRPRTPLPPETLIAFLGTTAIVSCVAARMLHRVAHGGELPGGVNVAPAFVATVPFVALAAAILVAALASVPRAIHRRGEPPVATP